MIYIADTKQGVLREGDKIYFNNDQLPYDVKAIDEKFAVCTRKLNKRNDSDLLWREVETGGYLSFMEAYNDLKLCMIYTILDFEREVRSTNNYIFNPYDYTKQEDIDLSLKELNEGKYELSSRHMAPLKIKQIIHNHP